MCALGDIEYCDRLGDGNGRRVTRELLHDTVKALFQISEEFHNQENYLPLCYKERQFLPLFGAALREVTPVFLGEAPVKRREDNRRSGGGKGWVDYWVKHRNSTYFIEIKHGYMACRSANANALQEKWGTANQQLHSAKKDLRDRWNSTENMFRISLLIVPFYAAATKTYKKHISLDAVRKCDEELKGLKPTPDWSALCILSEQFSGPYEYWTSREYHPAIGVYALVK